MRELALNGRPCFDIGALPVHRPFWPSAAFAPEGSADGDRRGEPRRVLVVEDDFLVAGELEHWLSNAGFEVVGPAGTAEEAITLARETKPDLVVMDIRLAGSRDGVDAAIEIYRSLGIRSVFATAQSDARTMARGQEANPLAWVAKPYSPSRLVTELKALLAD
jgi:DNA-binding NarL/FixJ family response regulator